MKTCKSHCLFALARSHGYKIPAAPDVGRYLVPAVGITLVAVQVAVRIIETILVAVFVRREPRKISCVGPVVPIQPCPRPTDTTQEPAPAPRPLSELGRGRLPLPLAPLPLWPVALPLVEAAESEWMIRRRLRYLEPSKTVHRQLVRRRRQAMAFQELERPEAVCAPAPAPAPASPVTVRARYSVQTWDMSKQAFTPQKGVPQIVEGIGGLRHALRLLSGMGYGSRRDPSVLIERVESSYERLSVRALRKLVPGSRLMRREELLETIRRNNSENKLDNGKGEG